jgi:hypothetical protein
MPSHRYVILTRLVRRKGSTFVFVFAGISFDSVKKDKDNLLYFVHLT